MSWKDEANRLVSTLNTMSKKTMDDSIRHNAENVSSAGLEVRVTRVYDGIGLSGGRRCEWCLERCGENMTLEEAYRIGAFQRHEGCECIVEYTSNKGVKSIQTGKYSGWNYADELEKRKSIGLNEPIFAEELLSRVSPYIEGDIEDIYLTAKNGGLYKEAYNYADSLTKPRLEKAIRSHIRQAEEHEWKIRNPEENSDRYKHGNDDQKKIVLNDWYNHRRKNSRLAAIEIKLWGEKFK